MLPGLWALPVTIPSADLEIVHAYALRVDDGLVLVDLGWGNRSSLASLEERLAELGASVADIRGALFTHGHRDHYGLAAAVRERSGAWLALHPADRIYLDDRRSRSDWLRSLSEEAGFALAEPGGRAPARSEPELPVEPPDRPLADGDVFELGSWRLLAVHTPGHSPGHTCFVVDPGRVVLLGDHVLSWTTPNVSHWPWSDGNPLGDYLDSLRRIAGIGAGSLGLPGHEERIPDIPARVAELLAHHESQLDDVTELVGAGHETIAAVAERLRWSRPWAELGPLDRLMALGEAHAHLRELELRGRLTRIDADGRPRRFALA